MEFRNEKPLNENPGSTERVLVRKREIVGQVWLNLPVWVQALILGTIVYGIGTGIWLIIISLIPIPFSFITMIGVFWVYLKYFSGNWGPKSTIKVRRDNFRSGHLLREARNWSALAVITVVVGIQAVMVLTFRLVDFPAETFDLGYNFHLYPSWAVIGFIGCAALAAGIFEEVGFRGYMQVPLERRYGSTIAIGIVALLFTVSHFNQVWAPPAIVVLILAGVLFGVLAKASNSLIPGMVAHVMTDVIAYSYWWSGLAGAHKVETIFITGVDLHFLLWLLIVVGSLGSFGVFARKLRDLKSI
ncbi:MAG: CPBP family intramembrane metalloprotease [Candidatus Heimdallarchaeota archaeon]|nr:MAG: CPBP family intramembrane metalloprotease [Candidatus Heimdallarchaeota archaeon]